MPDSSNTSTAIDLLSKASEVVSEEITSETKEIAPYTRYSDLKMFLFSKSQIQQSWLLMWLNCASAIDIWFTYFIFDHLSIVSQVINENTWIVATKFEENLPPFFKVTYLVTSNRSGRFFKCFWPSQNILTLKRWLTENLRNLTCWLAKSEVELKSLPESNVHCRVIIFECRKTWTWKTPFWYREPCGRIDLGDVTPHNIKLLKKVNQVVFPIVYHDKFYKDVLGSDYVLLIFSQFLNVFSQKTPKKSWGIMLNFNYWII